MESEDNPPPPAVELRGTDPDEAMHEETNEAGPSGANPNNLNTGTNQAGHAHTKRKHHRRAKKGGRRRKGSIEQDDDVKQVTAAEQRHQGGAQGLPGGNGNGGSVGPGSGNGNAQHHQRNRRSRHEHHQQVYLRPTNGPLLNAPRNSTQFIIDDHDDLQSRPQLGDVDFEERDFQDVYESAHQEELSAWDRRKLREEISNLEKRQKDLVNVLARIDPEIYLQKLQAEYAALKETNRTLKEENAELAIPDSSTGGPD